MEGPQCQRVQPSKQPFSLEEPGNNIPSGNALGISQTPMVLKTIVIWEGFLKHHLSLLGLETIAPFYFRSLR